MERAARARKIGAALLVTAISLVLGEAALRLVDAVRPSFIFHDDSYNRFRARPGSVFCGFPVNSLGFLDVEFSDPDPGRCRIVALGDSFAFGVVPYESNYLTLLEEHLSDTGSGVEVLNMGIPRTAPPDYLNLLVNEGLALDPDLVLVSLYVGNDLTECLERRPPQLWERSHVATLVRSALLLHSHSEWGAVRNRRRCSDDAPTFNESSYIDIVAGRATVYMVGWEGLERSVESAVGALEELASLCRRRGIAVAVVLIPEETQLDGDLQEAVIASSDRYREHSMDFLQPNRILARQLGALGIPFLDLYPAFAAATARGERLYKLRDTHWNIAGNRLAAEQITTFLQARDMVSVRGAR